MADPARSTRSRLLAVQAWAELRELLDLQLSPLGVAALDALAPAPGEVVVDIGCGTGQTTRQIAERVGAAGRVVGVDIAPGLLGHARRRTMGLPQVGLVACDAQRLPLPAHSVDALFSRFGVMAFTDPAAAFVDLHRAARPGGRLAFVCWRGLAENELDLLPLRAAGLEGREDAAPFSFADPGVLRAVLGVAGFREVEVRAHDARVSCGGLDATASVLLRVGPLGRILREDPGLRPAAERRVRAVLADLGDPARVALSAATWVVTARA